MRIGGVFSDGDRGNRHSDHQQVSPRDTGIIDDLRLKHISLPLLSVFTLFCQSESLCSICAQHVPANGAPRTHTHTHTVTQSVPLLETALQSLILFLALRVCVSFRWGIMRSCLTAAVLFSTSTSELTDSSCSTIKRFPQKHTKMRPLPTSTRLY